MLDMTHYLVLVLMVCLISSCGDEGPVDSAPNDGPPATFAAISNPNPRMDEVEKETEIVANRLIEFSYRLKERDLRGASQYIAESFKGTPITHGEAGKTTHLPLNVVESFAKPDAGPAKLDRASFLGSLDETLASFATLDRVFFKTRGAEFSLKNNRALLKMTASIIGTTASHGRLSIYAWADAAAELGPKGWVLTGFKVRRTRTKQSAKELFTDIADVAGVAIEGPRVGTEGNDKFYWRGASVADFNADGLNDIFSSGFRRNYLYVNMGNGKFHEVAEQFNIAQPAGPTSVLFFDFDRDGDKDLFMSFVGWEEDGLPLGGSLRLFRNDKTQFVDVSSEVGLDQYRGPSFSAIVGDFDQDGWLDIYVCNYERLDSSYPDSWFAANNGAENFLLMNKLGKSFSDEATKRGITGKQWTFAAAAADFDRDGDLDIYSVNDYGENALFVNDGQGNFIDRAQDLGVLDCGNGMGVSWGDFNNDGWLDLYVSNMSSSAGKRILSRLAKKEDAKGVQKTLFKLAAGNSIFLSNGKTFAANPVENGGRSASWAWSPVVFDADLDGNDDVYVANGFISGDSLKDT